MINIKSEREIMLMKHAGKIVYETHQYLKSFIKEGISTLELDQLAENFIRSKNAIPSFKNYDGFPATICTSINEQVVHGIPKADVILKNGDIISIDIGACYEGYHGDSAWSYAVGKIDEEKKRLLKETEEALYIGLKQVKAGNRVGDIGHAIEKYALKHHLGVVKELVGHGIGTKIHELPDVPNYGPKNMGVLLREGMTIAVEPMLNLGTADILIDEDDWTIETSDSCPSAHFEHTVVVTKDGYQILTGE